MEDIILRQSYDLLVHQSFRSHNHRLQIRDLHILANQIDVIRVTKEME